MLFDTDVLIWLSRGDAKAVKAVNTDSDRVISAVTYMEFLAGCESKQKLAAFQKLLDVYDFEIIEISSSISAMAGNLVYQYALSHSLEMGDALIAATAIKKGVMLLTANDKDYRFIGGLSIKKFRPTR